MLKTRSWKKLKNKKNNFFFTSNSSSAIFVPCLPSISPYLLTYSLNLVFMHSQKWFMTACWNSLHWCLMDYAHGSLCNKFACCICCKIKFFPEFQLKLDEMLWFWECFMAQSSSISLFMLVLTIIFCIMSFILDTGLLGMFLNSSLLLYVSLLSSKVFWIVKMFLICLVLSFR
jgi:hypothetical protein